MDRENPALAKLLVSVRDAREAKIAMRSGVDWIDLKEPNAGALGAPDLETARSVAEVLGQHAARSVALGELRNLDFKSAVKLAELFPILKIGLSKTSNTEDWRNQLRNLSQAICTRQEDSTRSLVPVIYADWQDCAAPDPETVIQLAGELHEGSPHSFFVLVDTYHKNGQSLLDHANLSQLRRWIDFAKDYDCNLLLAGSLNEKQVIELSQLPIEAVGVRGAVCHADRRGAICEQKLTRLLSAINSSPTTSGRPSTEVESLAFRKSS